MLGSTRSHQTTFVALLPLQLAMVYGSVRQVSPIDFFLLEMVAVFRDGFERLGQLALGADYPFGEASSIDTE